MRLSWQPHAATAALYSSGWKSTPPAAFWPPAETP